MIKRIEGQELITSSKNEKYKKGILLVASYIRIQQLIKVGIMIYNDVVDVEKLGMNLKDVREKHSMTIDELSIVMKGVSTDLIRLIERGDFIPTLEYIFDFCNYFKVSIDDIVISKI